MNATTWKLSAFGAVMGLAASTATAFAHHSVAMFDSSKKITLHGTVKSFEWTNPHIHLWMFADPKPGAQPELWALEAGSPGSQTRRGWSRDLVKPGDKVTVTFSPLRDGRHAGLAQDIVPASGQVLPHRSRTETEKPGLE